MGLGKEERRDEGENERSLKRRRSGRRLYSIYRRPGYNARICSDVEEIDRDSDSK